MEDLLARMLKEILLWLGVYKFTIKSLFLVHSIILWFMQTSHVFGFIGAYLFIDMLLNQGGKKKNSKKMKKRINIYIKLKKNFFNI